MPRLFGYHHVVIRAADLRVHIDFFTQALGLRLITLAAPPSLPGAWHAFLQLPDEGMLVVVRDPTYRPPPSPEQNRWPAADLNPALQHLALRATSRDDLERATERLRSLGIATIGPRQLGRLESVFFPGPEGLLVEIVWPDPAMVDTQVWEPDVVAGLGYSPADLEAMRRGWHEQEEPGEADPPGAPDRRAGDEAADPPVTETDRGGPTVARGTGRGTAERRAWPRGTEARGPRPEA